MTLAVEIRHRLGGFALDVSFRAGAGVTALYGRSGSGKTSVINVIAGLVRPAHGLVEVGGRVLLDTARGLAVPMHRRRVGYVFQEGRLFPHMSVRQNLLYGRWFARGRARRQTLDQVAGLLGIGALLDRRPGALSGGEKQRVAIGRALLAEPELLLMDEPLASLDEERKAEILPYLERLRDEARVPIVYVSHALAEVARLAATAILLREGKVVASGPVGEVLGRLDTAAAQPEAGEVLAATVAGVERDYGLTVLRTAGGTLRIPGVDLPEGAALRVFVHARDVLLALHRPEGLSALNVLAARVAEIAPGSGPSVMVRLDLGGDTLLAHVTRRAIADLALAPGMDVFAVIKSVTFDAGNVGAPRRTEL